MNKLVNIPDKLQNKIKIINTIIELMYGIKIIKIKDSNVYKLSNNNIWKNLPNEPESKILELKDNINDIFDDIDTIDTSELDV